MNRIIGLSGHMYNGKDYVAQRIINADGRFQRFALADPLKAICAQAFNLPIEYMYDVKLKATKFDEPIDCSLFHRDLEETTGLSIPRKLTDGQVFETPRELLQRVGTEIVRNVEDNYWLLQAKRAIQCAHTPVVVTDVRFPNEFHMIKALGGSMVRVIRPSIGASGSMHVSERALDSIDHDSAVFNLEDNPMPVREFVQDVVSGNLLKVIYK